MYVYEDLTRLEKGSAIHDEMCADDQSDKGLSFNFKYVSTSRSTPGSMSATVDTFGDGTEHDP